jgi:hypothetical protein
MFNSHALLRMVVSSFGCRHEWSKDGDPEPQRIVCKKCGLDAYVPDPGSREEARESLSRRAGERTSPVSPKNAKSATSE